jgi:hypothetical protein
MLALYYTSGNKDVRLAHTYNGLTLNNPADSPQDTIELNSAQPLTQIQSDIEAHDNREGSEAWGAIKTARIIRIQGVIRAPTLGRLHDQIKSLAAAFDPNKTTLDNPSVQGFLPYDFSVPTLDTTNYPSGLVPSRYYARAQNLPEPAIAYDKGYTGAFHLDLFMRDPRRYLQAQSQFGLTSGDLDNRLADFRSWPSLTLTMTGAGSATTTFTNTTLGLALVLNLSSTTNGQTVVVDFEQRFISIAALSRMDLYGSGDYWWMKPGVLNAFTTANLTNISALLLTWRPAFCL